MIKSYPKMIALEIMDKILEDRSKLNLETFSNKYWYEMHLCEICTQNDGTKYDSQSDIKYKYMDVKDNKLILLNKNRKVVKELSRENVEWIHYVYLCDKNLKILVSDLNFAEFKEVNMKKKINELCGNDLKNICEKYFNKNVYDTCKNCPLIVDTIHCVRGLVKEKSQLTLRLTLITELLDKCYDKEIEVEEND